VKTICILFFLVLSVFADEREDPMALASLLIQGQSYERALTVLEREEALASPQGRRLLLTGLAHLGLRQFSKAIEILLQIPAEAEELMASKLYLAKAYMGMENYAQALATYRLAATSAEKTIGLAHCHWKLGESKEALESLAKGEQDYPTDEIFIRQRISYWFELGLGQAAQIDFERYGSLFPLGPEDYRQFIENLIMLDKDAALSWLERGAALFPSHPALALSGAQIYLRLNSPFTAALWLERSAVLTGENYAEVADLYRRAGLFSVAESMSLRIEDQTKRAEMSFALMLERGDYQRLSRLSSQWDILGISKKDEIAYALAYSHFASRRYDVALASLSQVTSTAFVEKIETLRRSIVACQTEEWSCAR
jgi:tetratricopeptide (TPR) repeat protein